MNIEINTSEDQSNEFAIRAEESYYKHLSNMKFNDTEDFGEDFGATFMFL